MRLHLDIAVLPHDGQMSHVGRPVGDDVAVAMRLGAALGDHDGVGAVRRRDEQVAAADEGEGFRWDIAPMARTATATSASSRPSPQPPTLVDASPISIRSNAIAQPHDPCSALNRPRWHVRRSVGSTPSATALESALEARLERSLSHGPTPFGGEPTGVPSVDRAPDAVSPMAVPMSANSRPATYRSARSARSSGPRRRRAVRRSATSTVRAGSSRLVPTSAMSSSTTANRRRRPHHLSSLVRRHGDEPMPKAVAIADRPELSPDDGP